LPNDRRVQTHLCCRASSPDLISTCTTHRVQLGALVPFSMAEVEAEARAEAEAEAEVEAELR
jgi:hypothetical protein